VPALGYRSKAAAAVLLLALAACSRAPAANNAGTSSDPGSMPNDGMNMMAPDSGETGAPAPTMAAPRDEPDAAGPRNSFIVCPGNPGCPPAGGTRP